MKINPPWNYYLILATVAGASFWAAKNMPTEAFLREMAALPGVAAMLTILIQAIRDHSDFQRQRLLQAFTQDFELATTSHMANTVFDKHVVFCEAYIGAMTQALRQLFADGPSTKAMELATGLGKIRNEHATWLTPEIEKQLIELEHGFRIIGAKENLLQSLPVGEQRTKVVEEIYKKFQMLIRNPTKEVSAKETAKANEEAEVAITDVIIKLRELLGVLDLTLIRRKAVRAAANRIE